MAGQSHVDQAGDHHGDPEHPTGGQEQEGEEVAHHLRGHEARGELKTGDRTETPQLWVTVNEAKEMKCSCDADGCAEWSPGREQSFHLWL